MDPTPFLPFYVLASASLVLLGAAKLLEHHYLRTAQREHRRARTLGQIACGHDRAERMVQHTGLTRSQRDHVHTYIDLLERMHDNAGLGLTDEFFRLRQTLTRNNCGLRVVV